MSSSMISPPPNKTPGRRHNPYATSTSGASPCNTPLNSSHAASFLEAPPAISPQPSLSSSFANPVQSNAGPNTPLDAADPTLYYRQQQQQQQQPSSFGPNAAAAQPFSPMQALNGPLAPQPVPNPGAYYGDAIDPATAVMMYNVASAAANAAATTSTDGFYGGNGPYGAAPMLGGKAPAPGTQFVPQQQQQFPPQQQQRMSVGMEPVVMASALQQQQQQQPPQQQQQAFGGSHNTSPVPNGGTSTANPAGNGKRRGHGGTGADNTPCLEDLQAFAGGALVDHARTASGSSFIQAAVKDSADPRCLEFVWSELSPALPDLLLDAHGCYVVKTLLERLPPAEIAYVLQCIQSDEQLGYSVCTHSLHTRRVVQHVIEHIDGTFLIDMMSNHCADIAMTQQGCIVMQRSMDNTADGPQREKLINSIAINLVHFAKDPFANYVVQHLMEVGDRVPTSALMWKAFEGHIVELACNKFASNVIEKCLFHCTAEVQHLMLVEMYAIGPQMLNAMLQDSFGNYIIQSSIALATFRDVGLIDEKLRPVLAHTPYGHKIEGRLDRRLKGKPVPTRGSLGAGPGNGDADERPAMPSSRGNRRDPNAGSGKGGSNNRRGPARKSPPSADLPAGERAW